RIRPVGVEIVTAYDLVASKFRVQCVDARIENAHPDARAGIAQGICFGCIDERQAFLTKVLGSFEVTGGAMRRGQANQGKKSGKDQATGNMESVRHYVLARSLCSCGPPET